MAYKVLDDSNLGYLLGKIKAAFWRKAETTEVSIDNAPTSGSNNLVKSGGVYTALSSKADNSSVHSIPSGGTQGQVLKKSSSTDYAVEWGSESGGTVTDVTVGGTSVVTNGVAAVPAIPTVPDISTDISADATSNTKTASPKAVKTYVDNICGDIETLLAAI